MFDKKRGNKQMNASQRNVSP